MRLRRALLGMASGGVILSTGIGWGTGQAHADMFITCPDGHEGVVGGHTSCAFAANVARAFWATDQAYYINGGHSEFAAYSPVTGQVYAMVCVGNYLATFINGEQRTAVQCYGGDNAEVVLW